MARFIFTKTFNYRWPSRAMTEFRPDPEPRTVKAEVAEAAKAGGYGHYERKKPAARKPTAPKDTPDHDAGDAARQAERLAGGGAGEGDQSSGAGDGDVPVDRQPDAPGTTASE